MLTIRQRVARGAKLLDKRMPNWFKKVKVTKLEMTSPANCILGQLSGLAGDCPDDIDDEDWGDHGFDIYDTEEATAIEIEAVACDNGEDGLTASDDYLDEIWQKLHNEWLKAIRTRKERAAAKRLVAK